MGIPFRPQFFTWLVYTNYLGISTPYRLTFIARLFLLHALIKCLEIMFVMNSWRLHAQTSSISSWSDCLHPNRFAPNLLAPSRPGVPVRLYVCLLICVNQPALCLQPWPLVTQPAFWINQLVSIPPVSWPAFQLSISMNVVHLCLDSCFLLVTPLYLLGAVKPTPDPAWGSHPVTPRAQMKTTTYGNILYVWVRMCYSGAQNKWIFHAFSFGN